MLSILEHVEGNNISANFYVNALYSHVPRSGLQALPALFFHAVLQQARSGRMFMLGWRLSLSSG